VNVSTNGQDMLRGLISTIPSPANTLIAISGFGESEHGDLHASGFSDVDIVDLDTVDPGSPLTNGSVSATAVVCKTATDLRRAVAYRNAFPKCGLVTVVLAQPAGNKGAIASPIAGVGLSITHMTIDTPPNGPWVFTSRHKPAVRTGDMLLTIARSLFGRMAQPAPRTALTGPGSAYWRPGDPGVALTSTSGPLTEPRQFLTSDIVLRATGTQNDEWDDPRTTVIDRPKLHSNGEWDASPHWSITEPDHVPPIDEHSINPMGFRFQPARGAAELVHGPAGWSIRLDGSELIAIHPTGTVTDADIYRLRDLRSVSLTPPSARFRTAWVRIVAGLAMAGVPVVAEHHADLPTALGEDLVQLLVKTSELDLADSMTREEHSIRLRRLAARQHSTRERWRRLAHEQSIPVLPAPKVSVLLCTKRADYVGFALQQIDRQRHAHLEVVLTLHGVSVKDPLVQQAISDFKRPLTPVEVSSDVSFGGTLNQGAAHAQGDYLLKWDDDDWYGPEFVADLLMAMNYSQADLVGCLHQFVYLEQLNVTIRRPGGESELWSRHVSGGTLLMSRNVLQSVGGFNPIPRHVDTGLLRAVEHAGGRIYRTHGLGSMLHRRETGHTWDQAVTQFLRTSTRQWRGFAPGALIEADSLRISNPLRKEGVAEHG